MLSDGTNSFAWNARNQVATLNNVALQYDSSGRRTKNAAGTSFLYNGANAVQELSGSTVTANLLNGGIDEVFSRSDSSGAFTPLKDALGSTIALVNSSGNVSTSYTYDPFGNTSVTGTSNANEFQYTGRENEGNGLYYYRARYYSTLLGRFTSEDPLGFVGSGPNLYVYVSDSPTNLVDRYGLSDGQTGVLERPTRIPPRAPAPTSGPVAPPAPPIAPPGPGPVFELIAGGSGEGGVGAGPIGVVAVAGVIVLADYGYEMQQAISALNHENDAYAEFWRMQHMENQAIQNLLKQPKPLTGRESKRPKSSSEEEESEECFLDDEQLDPDHAGWNRCRYWCPNSGSSFTYRSRGSCPKTLRYRSQ